MKEYLSDILFELYRKQQLASLYLLRYEPQKINELLWVDDFIKKFTPLKDHPDILRVNIELDEKKYLISSQAIKNLNQFISTRPLILKKKLAFVFEAHEMTEAVANKMLKTFEELKDEFTVILLAPKSAHLLPTIKSRAIKIDIHENDVREKSQEQKRNSENPSTPQMFSAMQKNEQSGHRIEKLMIENLINAQLQKKDQGINAFQDCQDLLTHLRQYHHGSRFNNSKQTLVANLFE